MKFKYVYTGTGIITVYDKDGNAYTLSYKNRELILDEKLEVPGLKLVNSDNDQKDEIKENKLENKEIKEED